LQRPVQRHVVGGERGLEHRLGVGVDRDQRRVLGGGLGERERDSGLAGLGTVHADDHRARR
jgi:hypothetical protein